MLRGKIRLSADFLAFRRKPEKNIKKIKTSTVCWLDIFWSALKIILAATAGAKETVSCDCKKENKTKGENIIKRDL